MWTNASREMKSVCLFVCVCVFVCKGDRERKIGTGRKNERNCVCEGDVDGKRNV